MSDTLMPRREDARRDEDGHCTVCGCEMDEYGESEAEHVCPAGFRIASNTPITDAFMTLIDDSEIDLGMVAAKLGDMERELREARLEIIRLTTALTGLREEIARLGEQVKDASSEVLEIHRILTQAGATQAPQGTKHPTAWMMSYSFCKRIENYEKALQDLAARDAALKLCREALEEYSDPAQSGKMTHHLALITLKQLETKRAPAPRP